MSSNAKQNNKKILCFNMLNNKQCPYGNKCVYAHNLADQKIETLRHKAYTIIKSAEDLSHIDLVADPKLYETLQQLTKMCSLCNKNLCPGGYNCRNGSINMKSKVCYEDFMFGNCKRSNCLATHLTMRGFVPYNKQTNNYKIKEKEKEKEKEMDKKIELGLDDLDLELDLDLDDLDKKHDNVYDLNKYNYTNKINTNKYNYKGKFNDDLNNIKGVLLTEKFLLARYNKPFEDNDESSYSEDEEQIKLTMEYLNNEDDDSTDESIFLV